MDGNEEFKKAFEEAEENGGSVAVLWCPVVDVSRYRDSDVLPLNADLVEIREAVTRLGVNENELGQRKEVIDTIVELAPKNGVASSMGVRFVDEGVFLPGSTVETRVPQGALEFCTGGAFEALVLGLWISAECDGVFTLEVSVQRSYELSSCKLSQLTSTLKEYRENMIQETILLKLKNAKTSDSVLWLYNGNDYIWLGEERSWKLRVSSGTQNASLLAIFQIASLNMKKPSWKTSSRRTHWDESFLPQSDREKSGGLGISALLTGNGVEMRRAGGSARFFFDPVFHPKIRETESSPETTDKSLILLDTGPKEILYAEYCGGPPKNHRCLCGRSYPSHADNEPDIVNLRRPREQWIEEQYGNGQRGRGYDWPTLSSPHFYLDKTKDLVDQWEEVMRIFDNSP